MVTGAAACYKFEINCVIFKEKKSKIDKYHLHIPSAVHPEVTCARPKRCHASPYLGLVVRVTGGVTLKVTLVHFTTLKS